MAFENTHELEQHLLGKILTSIQLYNVNDNFLVFNTNTLAVIDGGIELTFEDHKLVIAWNAEMEMFDVNTSSIQPLLGHLNYYLIDPTDLAVGQQLVGSKLVSIKTKWNWFQNINDELEPVGAKQYILDEIILTFENDKTYQIATIEFSVENKNISNATFDNQGELLLSVDQIIEIA